MTDQTEQPKTPPEPTPVPPGPPPGKQGDGDEQERRYNKVDMTNAIKDRLKKQEASLLAKLGVSNLDEATAALTAFKAAEDAKKTELEKLQEKVTEAEYRAMQLEERSRQAILRAAVIEQASGKVAADKLKAALKLVDIDKLKINDDGEVEGLPEAFEALLKEYPWLAPEVAAPTPTPPKPAPKVPGVMPTNPASGQGEYDLGWFKGLTGGGKNGGMGRGGVVPPPGEK